ncbi:MAG: 30S ribosomal protein S2 [bacterium]
MGVPTMKQLLEVGAHFGHQTSRWNPKMNKYIYSSRNDIHVIDLHKTIPLIEKAYAFIKDLSAKNGTVLFVGTKKQAQESIAEEAKKCNMFYVNDRWLGGLLTNFQTIRKNISRLKEIEKMNADGLFEVLPTKEVQNLKREHEKLMRGLVGIREMTGLPTMLYVIDTKKEAIAIKEARKLGIPIIGVVDTNCDPDEVDYPIPANDDAIRAIKLLNSVIADAVIDGRESSKPDAERTGETTEIAEELKVAEELEKEELIEESGMIKFQGVEGEEEEGEV